MTRSNGVIGVVRGLHAEEMLQPCADADAGGDGGADGGEVEVAASSGAQRFWMGLLEWGRGRR